MMGRITPGFMQSDFVSNLHRRTQDLQNTQKQLNTGYKILLPSDDPANTVNYMEWQGRRADIGKFNEVIQNFQNKLNLVDGQLEAVNSSLSRARELVVQAANGTYTRDDRVAIAMELDQLIRQIASNANAEYKGTALFSGTSSQLQPYRITENFSEDTNGAFVTEVKYFGNAQEKVMDIGRYDRIASVLPGTAIFETSKTELQGALNVTGYVAPEDSTILIEGAEVSISAGDDIEVIAQKINSANLTVRAEVSTDQNDQSFFRITSLSPRQPWLQDVNGGTLLQDLGLVDAGTEGGQNYAPTAVRTQASIFDTLIKIREDLVTDDVFSLGGEDLAMMDQSLNNILRYRAYTGSAHERLTVTYERNTAEDMYLTQASSNAVDTNYPQTISQLKMAEFAHSVALNVGAKLLPPTLMDFLR